MKTLLEKVSDIDNLVRQLRKMESRLRAGQVIDAWRELNRIIALLEREKESVLADAEKKDS